MTNPSRTTGGHGVIRPRGLVGPNNNPISSREPAVGPVATLPAPPIGDDPRHQTLSIAPDVAFVTLNVPASANAVADVPLILPRAGKFIMLASCQAAQIANTLFMHFAPLNKSYSAGAIAMQGTEIWLPFCITAGAANVTKVGMWYLFKKALPSTIYFDAGQENGGGVAYNITFAISNDIDNLGNLFVAV